MLSSYICICSKYQSYGYINFIYCILKTKFHGVNKIILEMADKFFEVKISRMLSSIAQGIFDA